MTLFSDLTCLFILQHFNCHRRVDVKLRSGPLDHPRRRHRFRCVRSGLHSGNICECSQNRTRNDGDIFLFEKCSSNEITSFFTSE